VTIAALASPTAEPATAIFKACRTTIQRTPPRRTERDANGILTAALLRATCGSPDLEDATIG
jgi:hypothetical protein